MNRPKARGTAAETATLRWLRDNGFVWAERLTLTGHHDRGDISLLPGNLIIAEIKNHATAATGQPGQKQLAAWMAETDRERANARADHALLVVKRKGTTNPGAWWCYVTTATFAALTGSAISPIPYAEAPVCADLSTITALLRHAGYGSAPEDDS